MELRQLRYLLTIAETGNFTRAAEQLYVTQSALSQQIQSLEQEVGAVLLDRSRRGARLTTAGEILSRHAERIMLEIDQASIALRELNGLQRGELRLGVVQTVNSYFIPTLITEFAARYPDIRLQVEELSADDIESGLENGDLQVGISFVPPTLPSIRYADLFTEELTLVIRRDHPLAKAHSVPVAALDGMTRIMLAKTFCTRRLWEESARLVSAVPRIAMEINTVSGILSVVEKTGIPTVLPGSVVRGNAALIGVPLCDPVPSRKVGVIWNAGSYLCAASRAFIEIAGQISTRGE